MAFIRLGTSVATGELSELRFALLAPRDYNAVDKVECDCVGERQRDGDIVQDRFGQAMTGWEEFRRLILGEVTRMLKPIVEEHLSELGEATWNHLFELEGPTVIEHDRDANELRIGKLFRGFIEIDSCIRTLHDIAVYIGSFPYRNRAITRPRHIRYHVERYFQEVYILKERLVSYLKTVERRFTKGPIRNEVAEELRHLKGMIEASLQPLLGIRSQHVHEQRFADADLNRLDEIELLKDTHVADLAEHFEDHYEIRYREVRQKWKRTIRDNNKAIDEVLDVCGNVLARILFDTHTENLIYTSNPRQ